MFFDILIKNINKNKNKLELMIFFDFMNIAYRIK
jgi:hypothetical protein